MKDEVWINPLYKNKKGGVKLSLLEGDCESGRRAYLIEKMKKKMFPYLNGFNDADKKIICHNFEAIITGFPADILEYFIKNDFEKALTRCIKDLKNRKDKELYDNFLDKEVITFKDYNKAIKEIEECH